MTPISPSSTRRRSYRPPLGMPKGRDDWRLGTAVSVLWHMAVLALLLAPLAMTDTLQELAQGAGGAGPAGGGGGGTLGSVALTRERLRFIRVAPIPPPVVREEPKPVERPQPIPPPEPQPPARQEVVQETAPITGTSGGTGADISVGVGPGTGGGTGTGVGTGQGSGAGPGTGGGSEANHPPTPVEMFIPPMPVPDAARGSTVRARFDVDATGKVLSVTFTETRDAGYNRRLRDVLREYRFRPGTTFDGRPIRMMFQMEIDLH